MNLIGVLDCIISGGSKTCLKYLETDGRRHLFGHLLAQNYLTTESIGIPLRPGVWKVRSTDEVSHNITNLLYNLINNKCYTNYF